MADEPLPTFFTIVGLEDNGEPVHVSGRFVQRRDAETRAAELADKNSRLQWVVCRAVARTRAVISFVVDETV